MQFIDSSVIKRAVFFAVFIHVSVSLSACSITDMVGNSKVPAGTSDPSMVATPDGAMGLYRAAQQRLADAVKVYVVQSGLISDELRPVSIGANIGDATQVRTIDSRYLPGEDFTDVLGAYQNAGNNLYSSLQRTRGAARVARGALLAYAPLAPRDIIGHLFAIEGFAEVLLAELYCSGIPLSTVNFGGDYTLKAGSSTEAIYRNAIGLFDSAIELTVDSLRLQNFAHIGRARALLGLGEYRNIGAFIDEISPDYVYQTIYNSTFRNELKYPPSFTLSDGEGIGDSIGIKYASLNDPRSPVSGGTQFQFTPYKFYWLQKYDTTGLSPITIGSGIEAQLIRAEVELNTGGPWLSTLNSLRTTCIELASCPSPAPAGAGGIAGLLPLIDPGNQDERLLLLFRERAFWLLLTGQRQGDMRRLIRNYSVPEESLYAVGEYYNHNAAGFYGSSVNFPAPKNEELSNPLYHGCFNRGA